MPSNNTKKLKYIKVAQALTEMIQAGKLEAGQVLPPIRALMDQFQVSLGTVQNAIGELEKQGMVNRLASRGYFVTDNNAVVKPNIRQIAFLTPSLSLETDNCVEAMYHALQNHLDVTVAAYSAGSNMDIYEGLIQRVLQAKPAGIIAHLVRESQLIEQSRIPIVSLDAEETQLSCDRVFNEPYASGQKLVEHLYGLGHRKFILLLTKPVEEKQRLRFRDGVLDTLSEYDIHMGSDRCPSFRTVHGFGSNPNPYIDAQLAVSELLKQKMDFTALITDHDYPAVGALQAAQQAGLNVPDDLAVVSGYYCGVIHPSYPSITTMVSRPTIIRTATRLLLDRMGGQTHAPQTHCVHGEIQVGQSSDRSAEFVEKKSDRLANNQA